MLRALGKGTIISRKWKVQEHVRTTQMSSIYKVKEFKWIDGDEGFLKIDKRKDVIRTEAKFLRHFSDSPYFYALLDQGVHRMDGVNFSWIATKAEGPDFSVIHSKFGNFSSTDLLIYMLNALNGMEFLHNEGFLHRDVKTNNYIYGISEGKSSVLLCDGGNSEKFNVDHRQFEVPYANLRTAYYLDPLVISGGVYNDAADIYGIYYCCLDLLGYSDNLNGVGEQYTNLEERGAHMDDYVYYTRIWIDEEENEFIGKALYGLLEPRNFPNEKPNYEKIRKMILEADGHVANRNFSFANIVSPVTLKNGKEVTDEKPNDNDDKLRNEKKDDAGNSANIEKGANEKKMEDKKNTNAKQREKTKMSDEGKKTSKTTKEAETRKKTADGLKKKEKKGEAEHNGNSHKNVNNQDLMTKKETNQKKKKSGGQKH